MDYEHNTTALHRAWFYDSLYSNTDDQHGAVVVNPIQNLQERTGKRECGSLERGDRFEETTT